MPVTLSSMEFVIAHGASKFVRADKVAAMKRQEKSIPDMFYEGVSVYRNLSGVKVSAVIFHDLNLALKLGS